MTKNATVSKIAGIVALTLLLLSIVLVLAPTSADGKSCGSVFSPKKTESRTLFGESTLIVSEECSSANSGRLTLAVVPLVLSIGSAVVWGTTYPRNSYE